MNKRPNQDWIGHHTGAPFNRNLRWTSPLYPYVEIRHCGHPTALRPYYLVVYQGAPAWCMELPPGAFRLLRELQDIVAAAAPKHQGPRALREANWCRNCGALIRSQCACAKEKRS